MKTMTTKHTPTQKLPDHIVFPLHNDGGPFIKDSVGHYVCRMTELLGGEGDTGRHDPDSERGRLVSYMLRAVNAYEKDQEVIKEFLEHAKPVVAYLRELWIRGKIKLDSADDVVLENLEAVISKAQEGRP